MRWHGLAGATLALVAAGLVTGVRAQTRDGTYIRAAEAGAPAGVAGHAAVARLDAHGAVTVIRPGSNGFTCAVGVPGDPDAPFCADAAAWQWVLDAVAQKPRPTNSVPGIAYMARGGRHLEAADGTIVMAEGPGVTTHREPPHWMVFWPFSADSSGLPTRENPSGTYIMFANTPYAHLMIYQDPAKLIGRTGR